MKKIVFILSCLSLGACNSVYMKPHTLDTNAMIYAPRGGYSMQRSIKETMESRGYDVSTGKLIRVSEVSGGEVYTIPHDAKYAVNVKERNEILRPIWCAFNGFWWWNFNISIIDRTDNNEILSWRGRGCANSSLRKLNDIFDKLETKNPKSHYKKTDIKDKDAAIIESLVVLTQDD